MKFYSLTNPRDVIPVPSGFAEQPVFMEKLDEDGNMHLEVVSMTNVYEKIQASKDATNVNNIVRRLGGIDMVAQAYPNKGQFIDVVGMPTSLIEAEKVLSNFENQFKALSPEVRKQFNNNPFEFVAYADAIMSGKIKLESENKTPTPVVEKEVSE